MDAVTAVSGSGPAYFALLAEAMIEAGILLGLGREISTQLVVQTMLGTAKLLRDEEMHPVELREAVTSPGGTTIRAIRELEQAGVRAALPQRDPGGDGAIARSSRPASREATSSSSSSRTRHEVAEAVARAARARRRQRAAASSSPVARRREQAYEDAAKLAPDWSRVELWWGDERCVPPDDEHSNFGMAKRALLDRLELRPAAVHRIQGELGKDEAAAELRARARRRPLDLVLLGLGTDGHVASLFPNAPTLESRRRVAAGGGRASSPSSTA